MRGARGKSRCPISSRSCAAATQSSASGSGSDPVLLGRPGTRFRIGAAFVDAAEATLPADIRRFTRKRRAGDADAAVDPLSDPDVKAALARAEFEVLVGFQLTQDQLAYNATR